MRDLLGTPGGRPAPVLAPSVPASDPPNRWAGQVRPIQLRDGAGETILYVLPERVIDGELCRFGPPRTPIGMPLCRQGAVVQIANTCRGIPSQFPRDRRWRAMQAPGDRAYSMPRMEGGVPPQHGATRCCRAW